MQPQLRIKKRSKISYFKTYNSEGILIGDYREDSYTKICGKNSITKCSENNYYREKTQQVYYGSVADGEFVEDIKACQSGYALYFFGDTQLVNPSSGAHKICLRCVTLLDVQLQETATSGETS